MTAESNVTVAIRIRPLNNKEITEEDSDCVSLLDSSYPQQLVIGKNHPFVFDHIFGPESTQEQIYQSVVVSLLDSYLKGYNVTIFAYGQTGSGKTFTMGTGIDEDIQDNSTSTSGMVPRAIKEIFQRLQNTYPDYNPTPRSSFQKSDSQPPYQIYTSFLEIYNETVRDLLVTHSTLTNSKSSPLVIREDANGDIYLAGCVEEEIYSPLELFSVLRRGALYRTTGSTDMNLTSSRSHAIFTIILRQSNPSDSNTIVSKLHFVDLAGSERLKKTNAIGNRAKEAISINSGLLALGNVISALSIKRHNQHIPYRDSKLTRLLQNSLGGNSQTLMLACISPSDSNFQESLNTLRYANRAKNITNHASVNIDGGGSLFEIAQLKKQVMKLKQELLMLRGSNSTECISHDESHKQIKEKLERKIQDLIAENTDLRFKFDMITCNINTTELNDFMRTPVAIEMMNTINKLKVQLALYESSNNIFEGKENNLSKAQDSVNRNLFILHNLSSRMEIDENINANDDMKQIIQDMRQDIFDRQELLDQLERLKQDHHHMKNKYEEKLVFLQDTITALKKERDSVRTHGTSKAPMISKITREKYEQQIKKLSKELSEWKEKYQFDIQATVNGLKNRETSNMIDTLKNTIQGLRQEKSRIIHQMTEEISKSRFVIEQKEAEIKELKLGQKSAMEEAKMFKKNYEYQKSILRKKGNIKVHNPNTGNISKRVAFKSPQKENTKDSDPVPNISSIAASLNQSVEYLSPLSRSSSSSRCSLLESVRTCIDNKSNLTTTFFPPPISSNSVPLLTGSNNDKHDNTTLFARPSTPLGKNVENIDGKNNLLDKLSTPRRANPYILTRAEPASPLPMRRGSLCNAYPDDMMDIDID